MESPNYEPACLTEASSCEVALPVSATDIPTSVSVPVMSTAEKSPPTFKFWGGCILALAALAMFMSGPGQSYSVAVYIDPMLESLNLSSSFIAGWFVSDAAGQAGSLDRTIYSAAYTLATLVGGFCLPFIGRMLDKQGARVMLPLVAILLGLACYSMSLVTGLLGLCLCFTAIRSLGQGTLTLISTWMVSEWFAKRRGIATGLISVGGTLSVLLIPQMNRWVISNYDWRTGWIVCGALVVVSLVVPSLLFVRNRPEDIGLYPDGAPGPVAAMEAQEKQELKKPEPQLLLPDEESFELSEAIRSAAFWKVAMVLGVSAMLGTGLIFHQVSMLEERQISTEWAVNLIGFQAIIATLASLISGYMCDKNLIRAALVIAMFSLTASVLVLLMMPAAWFAIFYSGCLGFQGGTLRSAGTVVWPNYFGRLHQGSVRGMALSIQIYAAALGTLPLAFSKDFFGTYWYGLIFFLILPLFAGLWVATLKRPVRKLAE
ncbi:MAG: MFS transporter [Planctomycetaceae bacterium]|nr:MFS transporter [Planctomycetaceae bacterium]